MCVGTAYWNFSWNYYHGTFYRFWFWRGDFSHEKHDFLTLCWCRVGVSLPAVSARKALKRFKLACTCQEALRPTLKKSYFLCAISPHKSASRYGFTKVYAIFVQGWYSLITAKQKVQSFFDSFAAPWQRPDLAGSGRCKRFGAILLEKTYHWIGSNRFGHQNAEFDDKSCPKKSGLN